MARPVKDGTPRGIGYYLIALILLAVVPLVLISGVLIWRQSELQRDAFERSLLQTAHALSVAVDRQLNSYRVMLETLAESDSLARGDMPTFHRFSARAAQAHGAVFVSLFDRDGRQVFNTLRPAGEPLPTPFKDPRAQIEGPNKPPVGDPSYLRLALETGQPNVSDLTYGLVAGRLIFVVNLPVVRDGRVRYVLNAAFAPDVMTRLLQENPAFRGVPAVIFDRKGFIVGRWQGAEAYVGRRVSSFEEVKDRASGVGTGETLDGIKIYYSYARSAVNGWGVNVGAERGAIEGQIHTIWAVGLALAGLGLAVGVAFALAIAARLRRSIAALADSASRNVVPPSDGLRTREIAQLEQALAVSAAARNAQARERESRLVAEARKSEAEEANRMKDRFIAVLSHELRNPLAPIRTSVHLLRAHENRPYAPIKDIVDMLDRQSQQLTRLVNDLLDVSRIGVDNLSVEKGRVDLCAVARHALETVDPALRAQRHHVTSAIPAQPVEVMGDFARLSQLVSNLLDNAAKFTPAGGEITVSVQVQGDSALVAVKDSGRGIDPALLPEIFRPFMQTERKPAHAGEGGLGLGLALARSLAELHGGSLVGQSEGIGRGSVFVLRLPLAGEAPPAPARAAPADPAAVHRRVLVVDDNRDAADATAALLHSMGCEALALVDGEAALRAVREWQPDLVLLDIAMPGMDGYRLAREMRAATPERQPVLVALTGFGHDTDKARARDAGFDLHLVKPVEVRDLARALAYRASRDRL